MKIRTLKNRLLLSFLTVNIVLAVSVFCLGYRVVRQQIFERTQKQVNRYLDSARLFYASEIENIGSRMKLVAYPCNIDDFDLEHLRKVLDIDYLVRLTAEKPRTAKAALFKRFLKRLHRLAVHVW